MVPGFFNITSLTLTPGFAPVVRIMMVPAPYAPCPRTHLFLHCPRAQSFWGAIGFPSSNLSQIEDLWDSALPGPPWSSPQVRSTVITGLLWNLWKCRNALIFNRCCSSDFRLWQNRLRKVADKLCIEEWSSFLPCNPM